MSPDDTNAAAAAPTEQEKPDPFRRVVEVASGPNDTGYDDLVKQAQTLPESNEVLRIAGFVPAVPIDRAGAPVLTDAAIDGAIADVHKDVESSSAPKED
jgi:hypothetical protein